jgi:hypothetical protein
MKASLSSEAKVFVPLEQKLGCECIAGTISHVVIAGLDPAIHAALQHGPPGHRRAKRRRSLNGYAPVVTK